MTLDVPSSSSVPREPTQAMLASAEPINNFELMNRNVWRAMWDAAQSTLATPPTTLVESQGQTHSSEVGPSGAGGSAGTLSTPAASESATPEVREAHPQPHATTGTLPSDVAELCRILRDYEQLDGDGVFVSASRQACDKAATLLEAQAQEIARQDDEICRLDSEVSQQIEYRKAGKLRAERAEAECADAVEMLRVIGEEMVNAGYPGGDRNVTLASIRLANIRANQSARAVQTATAKNAELRNLLRYLRGYNEVDVVAIDAALTAKGKG